MTPRDIARAGRALFDIVSSRGESAVAVASLDALSALMTEHGELQKALASPFIPASARRGILDELAPRLAMPDTVRRTLHVLADQGVLNDVPALAAHVHKLHNRHIGIVDATVTTAVPLSDAQVSELQTTLSRVTGKNVLLSARVDPSVIGGAVARVGGQVFDGTLARQLARLQDQLEQQRG